MNILTMSISGGAIILAVLLIRFFAKSKIPRKLVLMMWGVAVARLLIPFSLPFEYSIYSFLPYGNTDTQVEIASASEIYDKSFGLFSEETIVQREIHPVGETESNDGAALETIEGSTSLESKLPMATIVYITVCTLAMCGFSAYYILCRNRFRRGAYGVVDNDYTREWLSSKRLFRHIRIKLSGGVSTPLTYGIARPVILMPESTDWKSTEKLDYILTHEWIHIKHFDIIKKVMLIATLCVHWFNPLVWAMFLAAGRDIELACDEAVIKSLGDSARKSYALALLDMAESRRSYTVLTNAFGQNAVEKRVKAIVKGKKNSVIAIIIACIFMSCMFAAFGTSALATDGIAAEGSIEISIAVNYEPAAPSKGLEYALNDDGKSFSVVGIGNCTDGAVVIPKEYSGLSVTCIGQRAFMNNATLYSVFIPDSITKIYANAFTGSNLAEIVHIPDSVNYIDSSAFAACQHVRAFNVDPANKNYISDENGVIYNKQMTKIIAFPPAFRGDYTIPDGIISIDDLIFMKCPYLTRIYIPSSIVRLGETESSIMYCTSLQRIDVDPDNLFYSSDAAGVLYNKSQTTLLKFPSGKRGSYIAPKSVTEIAPEAFDSAVMDEIYLPNIKKLSKYSMMQSNITRLCIGSSIEIIEPYAFIYTGKGKKASLGELIYDGTIEQWRQVEGRFDIGWNDTLTLEKMIFSVTCVDGEIIYD